MGQVFVNSAWHNHDEISVFERRRRLRENDALLQKRIYYTIKLRYVNMCCLCNATIYGIYRANK